MQREVGPETALWDRAAAPWVVGLGLVVAFWPALLELFGHLATHAWSRTALVFPWLCYVAIRCERRRGPDRPRTGSRLAIWSALGIGLLIELVAVAGDVVRLGRLGGLVALFGVSWGAGWIGLRTALLLVWTIPLPAMLMRVASPRLEIFWAGIAAALVPDVSMVPIDRGAILRSEASELLLLAPDGGLALGFGLAGLGFFGAVVHGADLKRAVASAILWSLIWIPLQLCIVTGATIALSLGADSRVTEAILTQTGWIVVVVGGVALSLRAWAMSGDEREKGGGK
ncbi:MAG: hypothetical protein NXI30_05810 [bacterium]|nr:hypothetical protein [bacterium]